MTGHRREVDDTVKISAWVGTDDWAWMQTRHPNAASSVLRRLIRDYRRKVEERDDRANRYGNIKAFDLDRL